MKQFPIIDKSKLEVFAQNYECPWGGVETIYLVPLELLHLNKDNGRIASWVSGRESNPDMLQFDDMTTDQWNEVLRKYIMESSSKDENAKTMDSLRLQGQLKVGAILSDGTVVAGNRRCTLLMELRKETADYDKFGYFKCAIFDFPSTEEGLKQLKRLETKTQYGEDVPVSYGPIEKLVDIYNNVLVPNAPYQPSEYAVFLNVNKSTMENLCLRAQIMVEYLKYIGKPGNYEEARLEKLDGPINELARVRKKVNDREWNRIRPTFYRTLSEGKVKRGDRTRVIRDQITMYNQHDPRFEQLVDFDKKSLLARDAAKNGVAIPQEPVSSGLAARSREDIIKEGANSIQKENARTRPIKTVEASITSFADLSKEDIDCMKDDEKKRFFQKLTLLKKRLEKLLEIED